MSDMPLERDRHRSEAKHNASGDVAEPSRAAPHDTSRMSPDLPLDIIFADIAQADKVVLAISGGPDSMALLLMAAEWAKDRAAPQLHVATVDHALRPESRAEAERVAAWAEALGFSHEILIWQGVKPKTRIQERARDARYALLEAYAAEIGADYLLTAHHADDQAETILFRLLRGSGLAGLAGMSRVARRGKLVHLRPLLGFAKADLIAHCEARGQAFIRDPSNDNPAFARTHLRKFLPLLAERGLDRVSLLRLGVRAARADAALDTIAGQLRASLDATRETGRFCAAIGRLADVPDEIFLRIVAAEISALSAKPLRFDRLEALSASLQLAVQRGETWRGSLAGLGLTLDVSKVSERILTIQPEKPRRRGGTLTENSPSPQSGV